VTILVGIHCKDGIVIGADSSSTFGVGQFRTIEQPTDKINIVGGQIIVAGTGAVGLNQRFNAIVSSAHQQDAFKKVPVPIDIVNNLAKCAIDNFKFTHIYPFPPGVGYGALLAFCKNKQLYLCEFDPNNFQPELKEADLKKIWYVAMGSGQLIADPFLGFIRDVFWDNTPPSCQDGIFAAVWTLSHTIDLNPGGINGPIRIATLRLVEGKYEARILDDEELIEHKQHVAEIKKHLREYRDQMRTSSSSSTPDIPK